MKKKPNYSERGVECKEKNTEVIYNEDFTSMSFDRHNIYIGLGRNGSEPHDTSPYNNGPRTNIVGDY